MIQRLRNGVAATLIRLWTSTLISAIDTSPTIEAGTIVPVHSRPNGSIYVYTAGNARTLRYVRVNGVWVPDVVLAPQTIDMADAQVALVYGTAGAGQVQLIGRMLFVDANSGGTEKLLLPPEATSAGEIVWIVNTGGESIVVRDDGDAAGIVTIATAKIAVVLCDGTTWRGIVAA